MNSRGDLRSSATTPFAFTSPRIRWKTSTNTATASPCSSPGGILLETMRIAATAHSRSLEWRLDGDQDPTRIDGPPRSGPKLARSIPLYLYLGLRSTDRRPYRTRPITGAEKAALEAAWATNSRFAGIRHRSERWRCAQLSARATDIRLRTPEAFPVHQRIIDWQRKLSPTGIPACALGLDRATVRTMRWAMRSWSRAQWLNRIFGTRATAAANRLCSHPGQRRLFYHWADRRVGLSGRALANLLAAGERIQRFWLTATRLGLAMQPRFGRA